MAKDLWEKFGNPNSNLTFNIIALSVAFLVILLCVLYTISSWETPDKVFNLIEKIIILFAGLLGGRSLSKK